MENRIIFNKNPLRIREIAEQFGDAKARSYFQQHFAKPESFIQFASLFQNYTTNLMPEFHEIMASEVLFYLFKQDSEGRRFCYSAPRGFAKSSFFNVIFNAWCSLNGFYHFIIPISDTFDQAKLHLGALKSELETNQVLNWIYPNLKGSTWGEEKIIVNSLQGEVLVFSRGAEMKIRGLRFKQFRPQLTIIDDLENLEAVYSEDRRKKLKFWFDNDLIPAMDRYNANIVYIGTVLHKEALLNKVLNGEDKYGSFITRKFGALDEGGKSIWEDRFPTTYLIDIRDNPQHPNYMGSVVFEQEMMNNPQDSSFSVVKPEWMKSYSLKDEVFQVSGNSYEEKLNAWLLGFELRFAGVDPAISENEKADFFSIYGAGLEKTTAKEKMFECVHTKEENINKQVELVCDFVIRWKIQVLGIESVAYQKGLYKLVTVELNKRGYYLKCVEIKTDKDKIRRAKIHSSAFEGGFILLNKDDNNYNVLYNEITEFPSAKKDDAFDSLMLSRESRQINNRPKVFAKKPSVFAR